jgi:hypothetical protein
MHLATDAKTIAARLYFLPVHTRVPLKFGSETLTSVTCARARVEVEAQGGRRADGWGETPLSVQWVWPSGLAFEVREQRLREFCCRVACAWVGRSGAGHPIEVGWDFQEQVLPGLLDDFNREPGSTPEPMPYLAALLCCSVMDQALHDAYGRLWDCPTYATYGPDYMRLDLRAYLEPEVGSGVSFASAWPRDFLVREPPRRLPAWHLVGGLDPVTPGELTGNEPRDGYPVLLEDWIRRDGLRCLKVKLRGNDAAWDYGRLVRVGRLGMGQGIEALSADFNCTVSEVSYVTEILDRLARDEPELFAALLYVEQPFPYELEQHRIRVEPIANRKPLFLDESAHDWRMVRLGRELGWNGVALKTCKTQTGAILSACWARAHGMQLMVQDLTNPMLAQIPHVLLAAQVGTLRGVETNAMQFYPEASRAEAAVHPGLFQRREGVVDWGTVRGAGFGMRVAEMQRELPPPALEV